MKNLKILVFGVLISGCAKEKAAPPMSNFVCDEEISFQKDVQPIITLNCANNECHDNFMYGSDILLRNYSEISSISTDDRFLGAIKHDPGYSAMPYGEAKLKTEEIQIIECWINQGRKNN